VLICQPKKKPFAVATSARIGPGHTETTFRVKYCYYYVDTAILQESFMEIFSVSPFSKFANYVPVLVTLGTDSRTE
jgi:hypothetical protein